MAKTKYVSKKTKKDTDDILEDVDGKVNQIVALAAAGYTPLEIIAEGYNRNTVYIQVGMYTKLRNAPVFDYQGQDAFEARIQAYMRRKKCDRKTALGALGGDPK